MYGNVVPRQVLYLGEIDDAQQLAWRKTIEVFNDGAKRQVALFGEDIRPAGDTEAVGVRLSEVQLTHLWQWDARWVFCVLWLKYQLKRAALGLTPRTALEEFKITQIVDVHLPTTDGRHLILSRYTQPEPEHHPLLD